MFCPSCGVQLVENAKFCHQCGSVLTLTKHTQNESWEICEIEYEIRTEYGQTVLQAIPILGWSAKNKGQFIATAIGSNGKYLVKATPVFEFPMVNLPADDKTVAAYLDEFIKQLTSDGWRPLPEKGKGWCSYRFQRSEFTNKSNLK